MDIDITDFIFSHNFLEIPKTYLAIKLILNLKERFQKILNDLTPLSIIMHVLEILDLAPRSRILKKSFMSWQKNTILILILRKQRRLMTNLNLFRKPTKFSQINSFERSTISQGPLITTKKANFKASKSELITMDHNMVTQEEPKAITKVMGTNMKTLIFTTKTLTDLAVARNKNTIRLTKVIKERTKVETNMGGMVRVESHEAVWLCLLFIYFLDLSQLIVLQVYYSNVNHLIAIWIIFKMVEVVAHQWYRELKHMFHILLLIHLKV